MNKSQFRIIIFDGSFQTTAFIRRLMQGLVKQHQIFVLGFNENLKSEVKGVRYIKIGSNQNKLSLLQTSLRLQGFSSSLLKNIFNGNKQKLQQDNLSIILNKIKPNIIHAQWNSVLPWLEPYLVNKKYPVILSQRGYQTNVRPFVNGQNFNFLQKIYPQLSGIHSVSYAIREKGKQIGEPFTRINEVVYTGLNLAQFKYRKKYKKSDTLKILSVGRPHWIKGYSSAIKALSLLKKEGVSFHYTIIGGAGDEELMYLINYYSLKNSITLTGKVKQEQVFNKMKKASVFLLPSLEEGIANVAVEAMALGTPVISTDCGGMQELITHNQEGWIVPQRDPKALAAQIQAFIRLSNSEIEKIRHAARQKVELEFNEEQMIVGMEKLYEKVLNINKA